MGSESTDIIGLLEQVQESGALENLAPPLQVALFLGAMSLLTMGLVSLTAFTRIVIVLSFVRRALTTQEIPPNPVILGLAIFMTVFVMASTFQRITADAIQPYLAGDMSTTVAIRAGGVHLHDFMVHQTRRKDLAVFIHMSGSEFPETPAATPMRILIPAFIISELKTSFIMGFLIYIPFLLIDLVVATVLMALGMMMMPPAMMSLPIKILLFIFVDGWQLVTQALSASFG